MVAARDAVAAEYARLLLDADGVGAVLERDVDRHAVEVLLEPHRRGRFFHRFELEQLRIMVRIALRAEHLLGPRTILLQNGLGVVPNGFGPDGIFEDAVIGFEGHVCVDQRGAAEPAADEHVDVAIEPEIVEAGLGASVAFRLIDLGFAAYLPVRVGILARLHLLAALEQAHLLPGPRQARGGNRPPVAGAHDDDLIMIANIFERSGDPIHRASPLRSTHRESDRASAPESRSRSISPFRGDAPAVSMAEACCKGTSEHCPSTNLR